MSKTEQIIDAWESAPGNSDALRAAEAMVAELRRLTKLQEAYWAECEAWREVNTCAGAASFVAMKHGRGALLEETAKTARAAKDTAIGSMKATDAARREAGEV